MAAKKQHNTYIAKLANKFLLSAAQQGRGNIGGVGGILLAGDPGIGKTTFMELFSDLTGVHLITIEIPHIVEEHIINIPFLIYNPATETKTTGKSQLVDQEPDNKNEYDMVLADSHLYTQLVNARSVPDQQYIDNMTDPNPNSYRQRVAQDLYKQMGGNERRIPPAIQEVRKNFNSVLFFDEYFREAPPRIRNILRDTINGNIGLHKIPKNTFIVYASNMKDEGLDEIPMNTQMSKRIEFKAPTQEEWFNWLQTKYKNDPNVTLHPEVIKTFKTIITDKNMSIDDAGSGVRSSPRRWEQLVIYVNQSIPLENKRDAQALMTNVRNNFINYETGEHSPLAKKVTHEIAKLINKTSPNAKGITQNANIPGHQWEETLNHHIKTHMKSGKHRKYIPVVSGAPGVGKTSQIKTIADKNNLIDIGIDCAKLFGEDVVGMPTKAGKAGSDKIEVRFTIPQLHEVITREIADETEEHFEALVEEHGNEKAQEEFEKWENQDWKFLLFFDELNRVDKKTFNSLRRIILEKNFGPASDGKGGMLHLPDGSIVVGAINPDPDTGGTESMTGHFRDVIDVVDVAPSWNKQRNYMMNIKKNEGISEPALDAGMHVLDELVKKFGDKERNNIDERPFFIRTGDVATYVSPREYTSLFGHMAAALDQTKSYILNDPDIKESEGQELIGDTIADELEEGLTFPVEKQETAAHEEFVGMIRAWGEGQVTDDAYDILIRKKVKTSDTWEGTLSPYLNGDKNVTTMPQDSNINTRVEATNTAQFVEEVSDALSSQIVSRRKQIFKMDEDRVHLNGEKLTTKKGDKTHLLGNTITALLLTLKIFDYQADRIIAVGKAMFHTSKKAVAALDKSGEITEEEKDQLILALAELRTDIHDALVEIKHAR